MATLQFEVTLSELIDCYTKCEVDRVPKADKERQRQAKADEGTQRPAKTPKDALLIEHEGSRSCGYTNRSFFYYTLDELKDKLAEAAEDLDLEDLNVDWLDDFFQEEFHIYEDCQDDEIIYLTDGMDIITQETSAEDLEDNLSERAGDDVLVCYEDQWYRGWGFSASIELPNDRKRGQIHNFNCEVEFDDWGDAHPAGCGIDWGHYCSEAFAKKCMEYIVSLKIEMLLDSVKSLELDLDINLAL